MWLPRTGQTLGALLGGEEHGAGEKKEASLLFPGVTPPREGTQAPDHNSFLSDTPSAEQIIRKPQAETEVQWLGVSALNEAETRCITKTFGYISAPPDQ